LDKYILAIDQSTAATKAVLFDSRGSLLRRVDRAHRQIIPRPGWVEHDGLEIYRNLIDAVKTLIADTGVSWSDIKALAITNQRETVIAWDRETGLPVHNAIVWQCARAEGICRADEVQEKAETIRQKTGLRLSPYFSAPKLKWLLDNAPGARSLAEQGRLLAGTMDTYLIWKLTGGRAFVTDYSNASRTMLLNIHGLDWDDEILGIFGIPRTILPRLVYSNEVVGTTDFEGLASAPIPISGILGDSHGAMFAQNCWEVGMAKATYGTGSSIMMNLGHTPMLSSRGLVTSVAWGMDGGVNYVLEGNVNYAAATVQWLIDGLGMLEDASRSEAIARDLPGNGGVYIVPAFTGLGAPYWDGDARALICGMSAGANKSHIVRAALESIAYQVKDIVDCMVADTGLGMRELRVDGGPTRNRFLMQFQSDMLDCRVQASEIEELSAMGSAMMAGLAVGFWKGMDELPGLRKPGAVYMPSMDGGVRQANYQGWTNAVKRARINIP
jgi:glycerol kinase